MKLDPNTTPKWIIDLDHKVQSMPFGEVIAVVHRHRSKTDIVTIAVDFKLHPKDNQEAFFDIEKFINSFLKDDFNGKVEFALDFKGGTIQMITIKNKEIRNYGNSSSQVKQ